MPELSSPDREFPSDASLVNVREDYGAAGDGSTDDTESIRTAIRENVGLGRILFFPAGTYVVSGPLDWRDINGDWQPWLAIQGAGRNATTIKLADNSEGFDDGSDPLAVVTTASGLFAGSATGGGRDHEGLGEGNEAFKNYLFDMTIDTGAGNPGAIGIDFLANNAGGVMNVTIRSGDGQGKAGLSMNRRWPGPALVKNLLVEGFDYGVMTEHTEYGITFEHLVLLDQQVAGIHNDSNVLSIRGMTSRNKGPAVMNISDEGLVALVEAQLGGGSEEDTAIENNGHLYLRDVEAYGYGSVTPDTDGLSIREFATANLSASESATSLGLPIRETPSPEWSEPSDWVSVTDETFADGADPSDTEDDTTAIQAALDSGSSTVYFPSTGLQGEGRYLVSDTLVIPPTVEHIVGFDSFVAPAEVNSFQSSPAGKAMFRVEGGDEDQTLVLERFRLSRFQVEADGVIWIEHASPRTLVLKHLMVGGGETGYSGQQGSGPMFIEDYCCASLRLDETAGVWARQLNIESNSLMLANRATSLWILGIKTERPATVIETYEGGATELLGGLLYPVEEVPPDRPAFINSDGRHSLVYAVSAYSNDNRNYTVQVRESVDGETQTLLTDDVPSRNQGSTIPLHNGLS